jgi:cob(I)alamin adenosyltransferase
MSESDEKNLRKNAKHKASMEKQKSKVDARIEEADTERGVAILLTGNGKGKSSSAFGMVMRALGYGHKIGVVQFIKGQQLSGEEIYLREQCPQVDFYQMGTGFTWDTQDRSGDIAAAKKTWAVAKPMLEDDSYDLVVLDELTYMLAYTDLYAGLQLPARGRSDLGDCQPSGGAERCGHRQRRWFRPAGHYGYRRRDQGYQACLQGRYQGAQGCRLLAGQPQRR